MLLHYSFLLKLPEDEIDETGEEVMLKSKIVY